MTLPPTARRLTWAALAFFLAKGLAWIIVAFLLAKPLQ